MSQLRTVRKDVRVDQCVPAVRAVEECQYSSAYVIAAVP